MTKKKILLRICCISLISALSIPLSSCGLRRRQEEYKRDGIEAMQQEEYTKALQYFQDALSLSSRVGREERDLALYKASAQYKLGKADDAITTLSGLLEFNDEDDKALFLMGLIYCDSQEADKALEYLTKASEISGDTSYYENAYLSLVNAGMSDQADTFYDSMSNEAKASKEVLRLRIISFEEGGDLSNALDSVDSYLAQFPDDQDMLKEKDFLTTALRSSSRESETATDGSEEGS